VAYAFQLYQLAGLVPYDLLMCYAFFTIASSWMWGRRREIPDGVLGGIGVIVPFVVWIFTQFDSWSGLLIAAAYGGLWRWASEHEASAEDAMRREILAEGAAAAARRAQAPGDGVARYAFAQALEKQGHWAQALAEYEEAHRLSSEMFPESAISEVRERLAPAIADNRPPLFRPSARRINLRPHDKPVAVAAGALLLWNPPKALGLLAALAFARWLTSGDEAPTARASF